MPADPVIHAYRLNRGATWCGLDAPPAHTDCFGRAEMIRGGWLPPPQGPDPTCPACLAALDAVYPSPEAEAHADATRPEPPPQPAKGDLWLDVIANMQARRQEGIRRYGVPLQQALVEAREAEIEVDPEAVNRLLRGEGPPVPESLMRHVRAHVTDAERLEHAWEQAVTSGSLPVLDRPCPFCGAEAGYPCRMQDGAWFPYPGSMFHEARAPSGPTDAERLDACLAALRGAPVPSRLLGHSSDNPVFLALTTRMEAEQGKAALRVVEAAQAWRDAVPEPVANDLTGAETRLADAIDAFDKARADSYARADARFQADADRMHRGLPLVPSPTYAEVKAQRDVLLAAAREVLEHAGPLGDEDLRAAGFDVSGYSLLLTAHRDLRAAVDACEKEADRG